VGSSPAVGASAANLGSDSAMDGFTVVLLLSFSLPRKTRRTARV